MKLTNNTAAAKRREKAADNKVFHEALAQSLAFIREHDGQEGCRFDHDRTYWIRQYLDNVGFEIRRKRTRKGTV